MAKSFSLDEALNFEEPQKFDVNKSYGTPEKLLDNLKMVESSGNPNAVNKESGAMGHYQFIPSTVEQLKNEGVDFDPFSPKESRAAADYYIQKLADKHGGDYEKAMADYGGFKTKDPTNYVSRVLKGVSPIQEAQAEEKKMPETFSLEEALAFPKPQTFSLEEALGKPAPAPVDENNG